ncbi:MAG: M20/M25/M40 family metallo-hydrolase [Synergistaceae bacterium]|jgi:putative aminopeptidase FrvX|nr:M20/M25/M40 family metallo-hydrolase [Synergistaceae bacterium]
MNLSEILRNLCLAPAPSGYEREAARVYRDAVAAFVDSVEVDRAGNTIATIQGTDPKAPSVMVFAHLDQLGFIVRRIEPDGFLQIDRLGGIPEKVLPALELLIRTRSGEFVPGVIGIKSHHATAAEEKYKVDPVTSLFVDVGCASADQVRELGIEIGAPAIYKSRFQPLPNGKVSATAIDDRGGVAALALAASLLRQNRPAARVSLVGSVWEEFNIRGAVHAARALQPDIAICVDVILAGDTPDLKNRYNNALGAGPSVNLYSFHGRGTLNGTIPHEGLVRLMERAAGENSIPLQRFASLGILTDSAYVQMEGKGIACVDLGFPVRYTHTPAELCATSDIENLAKLIAAGVGMIDSGFDCRRYTL